MQTDDAARWREIEDLLDAALDKPAAERVAFVREQAAGRADIAERVLQLLKADSLAGDFLESSPTDEVGAAPEITPTASLTQIGPWKISHRLGRGGMGEVFAAERADGLYQHSVALKVLHADQPGLVARFEAERQILAQMNHAHIARLIDGGVTDDGRPYMAMEHVRGCTLDRYLQTEAPDLSARLKLFGKLCHAVSYAHGHLIVHRDIKPDNILITPDGEPKLLDFGIAKITKTGLDVEQTQALATPNYAAPEQLSGGAITTATDVYGIGATLYFLLCEKPPLQLEGASLPQVLDRLMHQEPLPPSQQLQNSGSPLAATQVRGDLDAICAKAMAKEPAQRYASVDQLQADLLRFLNHETVQARPPTFRYRAGRYMRRYRLAVFATTAVTLSLIAGLAATSWQAHVAALERDSARREAARLSTMRGSILRLFRSAASELDTDQLTARSLFAHSAQNIERDFGDDPGTAAAMLQLLGQLQLATEDYASAKSLLNRALALESQDVSPEVLADTHIDLAHIAYRDGDYDAAKQHYDLARQFWDASPARYPAELIGAATLASQMARAEGNTAHAVVMLEEAAQGSRAYWGAAHAETGIVLINLAVAHYYNNDLPAALHACADAWQVWEAIDRTASPDALNLLANWGLFALRYGDAYEGERRLANALELRTQLYGASAAQATLMKNLGVAHRLNGRRNAGMQLLEQAHWMAEKYAGVGGRLHAATSFDLAQALVEDGLIDEAKAKLDSILHSSAEKPYAWLYLSQALRASLMLRKEEQQQADVQMREALQGLRDIGDSALHQYADAERIYGEWLAQTQGAAQALPLLERAISHMTQARRSGHYAVLQIQTRKADLLRQIGRKQEALGLLRTNRATAITELGEQHPVTAEINRLLAEFLSS